MIKKLLLLLTTIVMIFSLSLSAQEVDSDDSGLLGDDFRVTFDGEINTGGSINTNGDTSADLRGSYVSLSIEWKEKIRAVITAKLDALFKEGKVEFNDDFSLGEFIKEAYIEIREVGGSPVAIIIGKQPMAFGQNIQAMPFFESNPLANLQEIDEVYGITVDLTEGLFGIFDQAEVSIFETEAGDMTLGKIDGVSIRLSKMITDQWLLTLSHAELGENDQGRERRTSVGLVGETTDGTLVGWVEGLYFSNNPEYPNSSFGITIGGMMRVHETTDVIVEYNWVERELQEIGIGVRTALTRNLSVGAEVRYRNYVERDNEISFGITLTYTFGNSGMSNNEVFLFGSDESDEFEDEDL
ncbi:MAG: hypothetical protein HN576_02730 [Bacteriovoracaceae bacterium]|nr:hypothetical protein [Bacteriovoracaceae bacterium]